MPKIIMTETTSGSIDGIHIAQYVAGREYDINDTLASAFIGMGVADYVRVRKAIIQTPENKAVELAPENKQINDFFQEKDNKEEKLTRKKIFRVYQLADELNISSKEVLEIAKKLKISVSAPASGLSEEEEKLIRAEL